MFYMCEKRCGPSTLLTVAVLMRVGGSGAHYRRSVTVTQPGGGDNTRHALTTRYGNASAVIGNANETANGKPGWVTHPPPPTPPHAYAYYICLRYHGRCGLCRGWP